MVAATSSMRDHIDRAFARTGLNEFITGFMTTSEVGKSKHDPLIYQLLAEKLGAAPEEILVLEDSLYALETAKKAGFKVVGVFDPNGEDDQDRLKEESHIYVRELTDVMAFVDKQ